MAYRLAGYSLTSFGTARSLSPSVPGPARPASSGRSSSWRAGTGRDRRSGAEERMPGTPRTPSPPCRTPPRGRTPRRRGNGPAPRRPSSGAARRSSGNSVAPLRTAGCPAPSRRADKAPPAAKSGSGRTSTTRSRPPRAAGPSREHVRMGQEIPSKLAHTYSTLRKESTVLSLPAPPASGVECRMPHEA